MSRTYSGRHPRTHYYRVPGPIDTHPPIPAVTRECRSIASLSAVGTLYSPSLKSHHHPVHVEYAALPALVVPRSALSWKSFHDELVLLDIDAGTDGGIDGAEVV